VSQQLQEWMRIFHEAEQRSNEEEMMAAIIMLQFT
jgi:hypothetical protein